MPKQQQCQHFKFTTQNYMDLCCWWRWWIFERSLVSDNNFVFLSIYFSCILLLLLMLLCYRWAVFFCFFYLSVLLGNAGGYKIALKYKMARCLVYIFWFIALAGVDGQKEIVYLLMENLNRTMMRANSKCDVRLNGIFAF